MKVSLDQKIGSRVMSRGNDCTAKQHVTAAPSAQQNKGYSNEEIYNMIMSFKHKISNMLTSTNADAKTTQALNTLA